MLNVPITEQITINGKRYILELPRIGKGGYGQVFKAYDCNLHKIIAIKKMSSKYCEPQIKALQQLSHPTIIEYLYNQKQQNSEDAYIMMEYFEGMTLNERIASFAEKAAEKKFNCYGLPERTILMIAKQLLEGFQYMHKQNFRHGDIKPQNILVNSEGDIRIIDFGLAKKSQICETGTTLYSPPQCFEPQEQVTAWAQDVWGLGLVLYEMLKGERYFKSIFEHQSKLRSQLMKKKVIEHCKKGIPIKYSGYYSQIWEEVLHQMLNYQASYRSTMTQIKNKILLIQAQINSQQLSPSHPQSHCFFSQILQSQQPFKQEQKIPVQILKSETILKKTLNYLRFFYRKYQFLPKFCMALAKQAKYPFIANSYKFSLIFLAISLYLSSIRELRQKLSKNKLRIDFEVEEVSDNIELDMFTLSDQIKVKQIFDKYLNYYNQQFNNYQSKLQNKIIPKLREQFCSHDSRIPNQILKILKNLIEDISEYDVIHRQKFINVFCKLKNNLKPLSRNEMKMYYYNSDLVIEFMIIMISKFDEFFQNSRVASLDQMIKLKYKAQQMRQPLLDQIVRLRGENF